MRRIDAGLGALTGTAEALADGAGFSPERNTARGGASFAGGAVVRLFVDGPRCTRPENR